MPRSLSEIMKNTTGTLTEKIAGYSGLKRDMHARFVTPVTQEMLEGGERQVANSILLCGPTGCGKTVIAEAIYQFVLRGERVLIASQTNLAVDNALERLAKEPIIRAIRLNAQKSTEDIEHMTENKVLSFFFSNISFINS